MEETSGTCVALRTISLEDASIQAAVQPWVEMDCHQLDAGRFSGRMRDLDLGDGVRIVDETQSAGIAKVGATGDTLCTISTAFFRDAATGRFGRYLADEASSLFLLPGRTEYDARLPAGVHTLYVSLDQDALLERLRVLAPGRWCHPPDDVMVLPGAQRDVFIETAMTIMRLHEQSPEAAAPDCSALRAALTDGMATLLQHGAVAADAVSHRTRRQALVRLRQARAYIGDCLDQEVVPSIVDLCAALGVSERTLQYTFRDTLDMTPGAYLRVLRLNRARAMVLDPAYGAESVTQIAMRWGFFHLGRFAGDYRRMFLEGPADTRRRAAAAPEDVHLRIPDSALLLAHLRSG